MLHEHGGGAAAGAAIDLQHEFLRIAVFVQDLAGQGGGAPADFLHIAVNRKHDGVARFQANENFKNNGRHRIGDGDEARHHAGRGGEGIHAMAHGAGLDQPTAGTSGKGARHFERSETVLGGLIGQIAHVVLLYRGTGKLLGTRRISLGQLGDQRIHLRLGATGKAPLGGGGEGGTEKSRDRLC